VPETESGSKAAVVGFWDTWGPISGRSIGPNIPVPFPKPILRPISRHEQALLSQSQEFSGVDLAAWASASVHGADASQPHAITPANAFFGERWLGARRLPPHTLTSASADDSTVWRWPLPGGFQRTMRLGQCRPLNCPLSSRHDPFRLAAGHADCKPPLSSGMPVILTSWTRRPVSGCGEISPIQSFPAGSFHLERIAGSPPRTIRHSSGPSK
jgi:hypothetical protein